MGVGHAQAKVQAPGHDADGHSLGCGQLRSGCCCEADDAGAAKYYRRALLPLLWSGGWAWLPKPVVVRLLMGFLLASNVGYVLLELGSLGYGVAPYATTMLCSLM